MKQLKEIFEIVEIMVEHQQMPDGGENQLMDELRRLEQSARNYQQEVSKIQS